VREVEVDNQQAARFERELDLGLAEIAATVAQVEREGADALTAALRRPER